MESHFWVAAGPFFTTTLFVVPPSPLFLQDTESKNFPSTIRIFDSDGKPVNEVIVQFPANQVGILELDTLMSGCGLESGLQHGHLSITSTPGARHFCRMNTAEEGTLLSEPMRVRRGCGAFMPVTFSSNRTSMLCFINYGDKETSVRCRLFCGKRAPETICTLPPRGSRVLNVEAEFPGMTAVAAGKEVSAYLRFGTQSESDVGVQLLERVSGEAGASSYFLGTVT